MIIIPKAYGKTGTKLKICNLFCNIVNLFNLVVACCAKTDCIKLFMSYAIHGIYGLSATTFLHLQRPDLLHSRQGHPKGTIEKKTWKQQQSMLNAFWSHFKHFGRLLGKSYLFHTPSKTDGRVPSQKGALTPCNLTYWEASRLTFVPPLLTSLGVGRGRNLSVGGGEWGVGRGGGGLLTNNTFQLFYNSTHFSQATLSFQGHYFVQISQPAKIGLEEQIFLRNRWLGAPGQSWFIGSKAWNIAIQLVLQPCCKASCTFLVSALPYNS